ncbi:hypothetical protein CC1G_07026 [Coprinopsis cinerea okayama7|uniref:Uncharacterized protein n=1 Tax=Coprinopsis cinerea (strain Okayama-7 / 130 / ATCC MYA-4618 / FGSC 9003) TaxID=240176 RepID=A8NAX3_COPC7|nr:hypothetical protein CC1G_07026 [Coprinopsis cinerea okayama7\|eukprot:XP_001831975.2 hypothetical protein CC1G_07026 [Coprinopsis cinerea okayama7\
MAAIIENIDPILLSGPLYIGVLIAHLLFGAYIVQLFCYVYEIRRTTPRTLTAIVGLITIVETVSICLITETGWKCLVASSSAPDLNQLATYTPGMAAYPALNGVVACTVQLYFSHRIWTLSKLSAQAYIALVIALVACIGLGSTIIVSTFFGRIDQQVLGMPDEKGLTSSVSVALSAHLTADFLITVAMVRILRGYKDRTVLPAAKKLLTSFTVNTIENGMVTTICAATNLALFFARPHDALHVVL